jgi:LPS export ABC transporter protein LptC
MQNSSGLISFLIIISFSAFSCEKRALTEQKIDLLALPALTVKDDTTVYTDSGKVQLILYTPLMESFDKTDPAYSEFKSGINVIFYDGNPEPVASVKSKYAKFTESKNLWELRDSVIAVNENGEKLETELLFWDQKKSLIYTDRFVKITTEDQIIQGYGLESDPRLSKRKIKKLSATIYINEEQ